MAYSCKVLADSISEQGHRLTTLECTYPRFVHSEMMTHRMFSRNSASSRAIPISKMIQQVLDDPAMPVHWGKAQPGMQAPEPLTGDDLLCAQTEWLRARDHAVEHARYLHGAGCAKQITNRVLEPWMWITVIISATEWDNFFALRCHPDAQPEIRHIAEMMRDARKASQPRLLGTGEWHAPLCPDWDQLLADDFNRPRVAIGRVARVSYLTHAGVRDPAADQELCAKLQASGHLSPFEHVATPGIGKANFWGWVQYRELIPYQHNFALVRQS